MKNLLLLILILLTLVSGCKKVDKLTQFDIEYNETVVIPSSSGINLPFNLFTPDVTTNSASTFAVNDTRKDLIEEIKLTQLALTLTSPPNGDFGFLKSIELFISADGLPEEKIAWNENIPPGIDNYLELETTDRDVKEFIKKDKFTLRLSTVTDEFLTSDHHISIHSIFFVDAKLIRQ